ncbi:MAG: EF-hand domain-containing protein [Planctomycetes bacterium]|nr:EF-hand domain-containing protein [Planctomycetota bacterium]
MKRVLMLAAFLGFVGMPLLAQEVPEGEKPAETPKEDGKKEDGEKPAKPERQRPARGADRGAYQELGRLLREHDANQDGKLDKSELGDEEVLKKLDKDEDGLLTLQEMLADREAVNTALKAKAKAVYAEEFSILDRDDSGKLNSEELGDKYGTLLKDGDTDKDGELNAAEFAAAREKAAASAKPADDRPQRKSAEDMIKEADKDGDGKISKEEAPERLKQAFDKIDADGDGFLTKEEVDKLRAGGGMRPNRERKKEGEGEKPAEGKKPEGEKDSSGEGKKEDEF